MKKIYFLILFAGLALTNQAQLIVDGDITDEFLIDWIEGTAVEVSNLVIDCDSGAYGSFINPDTDNDLQVYDGILLTTGFAENAIGPNNNGSITGATFEYVGDADLELSIENTYTANDVCRIEFDVVPQFNTLLFNYVFGSEEYLEYVGTGFNDVFGFFISGPGIDGPYTDNAENFSRIPGTDIPIAINNVNETAYPEYYINNGDGSTEPFYSDSLYVQYDGLTTNLPGIITVVPEETYHCKIAIADISDSAFDSGIFLQRESFMSMETVGINETEELNVAIYPNPASSTLTVQGLTSAEGNRVEILNAEGRLIQTEWVTASQLELDINHLAAGFYLLKVQTEDGRTQVLSWVKR